MIDWSCVFIKLSKQQQSILFCQTVRNQIVKIKNSVRKTDTMCRCGGLINLFWKNLNKIGSVYLLVSTSKCTMSLVMNT